MTKLDMINKRFGGGVVIEKTEKRRSDKTIIWKLKCDCGKYYYSSGTALRLGKIKSCGCLHKRKIREFKIGQRFGFGVIIKKGEGRLRRSIFWELLCDCGNKYFATSSELFSNNTLSCGCFRKQNSALNGRNSSFLINISESDKINEWDFEKNKILPDKTTIGSSMKAWWICEKCKYSWNATISSRFSKNRGCPRCKESHGEKIIRLFLYNRRIKFEQEKTFNECKDINCLRFDFYLPDYNICIEFQGRQHYSSIKQFGGEIGFNNSQKRDQIKREFCLNNSIYLVEIPYWEIKNIEDILTKLLISNNEAR